MASVNEKELTRMIKSGELSGVYYLYGTDRYSVAQYRKAMIEKIVAKGDEAYNLHEFQGKDLDVEGLSEVCEAYPMFAEKMCVTVCDLDMETETKKRPGHTSINEDRMKLFNETVKNVPETTVLIFYTSNIDICDGKKSPTAKNKKLVDMVAKCGTVCEINVKTRYELIKTISARVSKLGCTIDENAAGLLADRCAGDMVYMMNEIDKLTSYANGANIDIHTVGMLTPDMADTKSYSLANAVAAGNSGLAMKLYHELINDPENTPIYLLYVLTGSMTDLYRARLALDHNRTVQDVISDFSYTRAIDFRVKNAFSAVRKASAAHLRHCLEVLAKADLDMKSSAGSPEITLEKAIIEMLCI